MAGISVGGGGGTRRSLDAEINAVPMIDLMMVTIAFLIITAVWSNMQRLDASATAPDTSNTPVEPLEARKTLEVEAREDKFILTWKKGSERLDSTEVAADAARDGLRYPALAAKLEEMWKAGGEHRDPTDRTFDRAVLRMHDRMPYRDVVGVMDALQKPRRQLTLSGRTTDAPAFELVMGR